MVGSFDVSIENAYLKYDFTISRNITIIRGDSATGKTTLVEMIRAYNEQEDSGITIKCEKPLVVVYGKNWQKQIEETSGSIVFLDEISRFTKSKEFAETIKGTDNYYVIVTREKLSILPYSITEIYGIRTNGRYAHLTREYTKNEFFRIYGNMPTLSFKPDMIITEDSNSGYEFWQNAVKSCECIPAHGKDNVLNTIKDIGKQSMRYLVVVDGAAFGSEIEELLQYMRYKNPSLEVYAPESFEYLILSSGLFQDKVIVDKIENTSEYADSVKYMSWERFYTALLVEVTNRTQMKYDKDKLNVYYLSERNKNLILKQVPDVLKID